MKNTLEGMWGRRKRGGEEGEGEHFYPLQHPKDRSIVMKVVILLRILLRISSIQKTGVNRDEDGGGARDLVDDDDEGGERFQNREDAEVLATILSQT